MDRNDIKVIIDPVDDIFADPMFAVVIEHSKYITEVRIRIINTI